MYHELGRRSPIVVSFTFGMDGKLKGVARLMVCVIGEFTDNEGVIKWFQQNHNQINNEDLIILIEEYSSDKIYELLKGSEVNNLVYLKTFQLSQRNQYNFNEALLTRAKVQVILRGIGINESGNAPITRSKVQTFLLDKYINTWKHCDSIFC